MANRGKPVDLKTGTLSKDKAQKRKEVENALKGGEDIQKEPPQDLCERGRAIYTQIIESLPSDYLNKLDSHIVAVVADSLANMEKLREQINELGPLQASESKLIVSYQKYSQIFNKFSEQLGLSPQGRSQIAFLLTQEKETEKDPLLKVLKGKKI